MKFSLVAILGLAALAIAERATDIDFQGPHLIARHGGGEDKDEKPTSSAAMPMSSGAAMASSAGAEAPAATGSAAAPMASGEGGMASGMPSASATGESMPAASGETKSDGGMGGGSDMGGDSKSKTVVDPRSAGSKMSAWSSVVGVVALAAGLFAL